MKEGLITFFHLLSELSQMEERVRELQSELDKALSRIRTLEEGIRNIPINEYGYAQREGCDANGAWDCFIKALHEYWKKLLEGGE